MPAEEGATLTGGCFCGAIRYEADGKPFHATMCHCASCRRVAAAGSVAWFSVALRDFHLIGAIPASFVSSPGVTRQFCATCSTPLTYRSATYPDEIDVTIGSLDDPNGVPPADHTQAAARLSWTVLCDGLPVFLEKRSREGRGDSAPPHPGSI